MADPTPPPNLLYYGDNLDILRRYVDDASVDLVYLDPPFNSNADHNVLFAEKSGERAAAQSKAFEKRGNGHISFHRSRNKIRPRFLSLAMDHARDAIERGEKMDHSSEAAQVSPTGWYVAVLLERFEPRDADAADPVCEAYENTVLISADSAESAYAKALALGAGYDTDDLVGGPDRAPYVGRFGGLLELLPVYDELRDGCEIMYSRVSGTRSELASMVLHKSELAVFRAGEPDEGEAGGTSR